MYVVRFGLLASLLSEALVSGFTTGAAVAVLTSQVKDLIGIKLTPVIGKFEIPLVRSYLPKRKIPLLPVLLDEGIQMQKRWKPMLSALAAAIAPV